jgi:peptide/nickel transport system permease protein
VFSYIARRIMYSVPVLFVASFIVFVAVRLSFDPTTKFRLLKDPTAVERARVRYGLNDPIPIQYFKWLGRFVRGDFGISTRTGGDVGPMVSRAFGFTVQLIIWGVLLALVLSIAIGVFSAIKQYSIPDYLFTGLSYVGVAMPPFWFGLLLIQVFGVFVKQKFNLSSPFLFFIGLHGTGKKGINLDYLRHLVLPVLTLTVQIIAQWSRFERSSMLDVLSSDYIRTARAKGVPRRKVVFRHAFRNALIPLVTDVATQTGALFGGLIITESIFSIPGMGRLFIDALLNGDIYVVLAWMLLTGVFVILFNLIADLLYGVLDPRVRLS